MLIYSIIYPCVRVHPRTQPRTLARMHARTQFVSVQQQKQETKCCRQIAASLYCEIALGGMLDYLNNIMKHVQFCCLMIFFPFASSVIYLLQMIQRSALHL